MHKTWCCHSGSFKLLWGTRLLAIQALKSEQCCQVLSGSNNASGISGAVYLMQMMAARPADQWQGLEVSHQLQVQGWVPQEKAPGLTGCLAQQLAELRVQGLVLKVQQQSRDPE